MESAAPPQLGQGDWRTLADAIFDRSVHQSHKIKLKGESMRKQEVENPMELAKKQKAS